MGLTQFLRSLGLSFGDLLKEPISMRPAKKTGKNSLQKRKPRNYTKMRKRKRKLQKEARKRQRFFAK